MKSHRSGFWVEANVALLMFCAMVLFSSVALAQQKSASDKSSVAGRYEGTAKNQAGEIIQVTFEIAEKDGAVTGMIRSDHGDFSITGGSHKGDDVTLEFDANGTSGTITLKRADDKLSGTWSAGGDGGSVDVKRAAAQETPKGKS